MEKLLTNLKKIETTSLFLYSLLLIPTIYLFIKGIVQHTTISRLVLNIVWISANHSQLYNVLSRVPITIIILGITYLYYVGYKLLKGFNNLDKETEKKVVSKVFMYAGLIGLILTLVLPFYSTDLYGYINRGAQQAFYHANPYLIPLGKLAGWHKDLMFHAHWLYNPSPYGFAFVYMAKIVCLISGHHFFISFLIFKNLNLALHLLTGLAIYKFSRYLEVERPWFGAYLYLMNPLILLQVIGEGHNDIFLSFPIILALITLTKDKLEWSAIPLLTLSFLTKYASILAIPFLLIYFIMAKKWKSLIIGTTVAATILGLLTNVYLHDVLITHTSQLPVRDLFENAFSSCNSLHALLHSSLKSISKMFPIVKSLMRPIENYFKLLVWAIYLSFYTLVFLYFAKNIKKLCDDKVNSVKFLNFCILTVLMILIMFASAKFNFWYIAMFFPLAFLLKEKFPIRQLVLLISFTEMLSYTPLVKSGILNYGIMVILPVVLFIKYYKRHLSTDDTKNIFKHIFRLNLSSNKVDLKEIQ